MIEAIIFDFDGIIVDSEPLLYKAEKRLLEKRGIKLLPGHKKMVLGTTLEQTIKILKKHYCLKESLLSIKKERLNLIHDLVIKGELKTVDGIYSFLKKIKGKYKLGIATSSKRSWINPALKRYKLKHYFDAMITAQDVKRHKPFPDIYIKAADKLGVKPEKCVALEDTKLGIESVKRAGMKCIALKQPYTKYEDLKSSDVVVKSFKEVKINYLENI